MLYFCCYQLFVGSLHPQLRTPHSLLPAVSFLSSAHVHGTNVGIHSLSVFSLLTHPLVLLISRLLPCYRHIHNRMCIYTTYKNCERQKTYLCEIGLIL